MKDPNCGHPRIKWLGCDAWGCCHRYRCLDCGARFACDPNESKPAPAPATAGEWTCPTCGETDDGPTVKLHVYGCPLAPATAGEGE